MSAAESDAAGQVLAFPGLVAGGVTPGGCEMGGGLCVQEPELEVLIPATRAARLLCRDHAGWFMLAAAEQARPGTVVKVRRLVVLCGQIAV